MEMEVIDRGAQSESSTILSTHLVPDGSTLAWSRICIKSKTMMHALTTMREVVI